MYTYVYVDHLDKHKRATVLPMGADQQAYDLRDFSVKKGNQLLTWASQCNLVRYPTRAINLIY